MARQSRYRGVTVGFVALGCPKNIVDSERMLAEIVRAGFLISAEPQSADVIVINTCAFISPAIAEALAEIKEAAAAKAAGRVKKVIVAGCLPERWKTDLLRQTNGVDAIVGLGQRDKIAQIIKETIGSDSSRAYLESGRDAISDDRIRLSIRPRHWAYLRISEGCSHRCSFCTIPSIRGPFRSKPQQLVLAEAAELVSAGAVELNIIAQDSTHYGRDVKRKDAMAELLSELEKLPALKWLRLMYLYPKGITTRLIETIAKGEKVVHYLDIPIQHINDKILKSMRRPDTKQAICRLIESLRTAIGDIVLRTTVIVGFPGETDKQFQELVEFVDWARFDALGCFKFYAEDGTEAAEMPEQVPEHIKDQRLEELMLAQQRVAFAKNKSRTGRSLRCLVDSVEAASTARGRFYGQAPDIDSVCVIHNCTAGAGQFINTKVTGARDYDLIVEQI